MLVVTQDFILGPGIERRKSVDPTQEIFHLAGQGLVATLCFKPFPTLLKRLLNGFSQGLSGFTSDLPSQAFGLVVFDTKRHKLNYTIDEIIIYLCK
jgi:hypothetical protein